MCALYGNDDTGSEAPLFSCRNVNCQTEFQSHAFAEDVIWVECFHLSWFPLSARTGRRTALDHIQQIGHKQALGDTFETQDSGRKDDEIDDTASELFLAFRFLSV